MRCGDGGRFVVAPVEPVTLPPYLDEFIDPSDGRDVIGNEWLQLCLYLNALHADVYARHG